MGSKGSFPSAQQGGWGWGGGRGPGGRVQVQGKGEACGQGSARSPAALRPDAPHAPPAQPGAPAASSLRGRAGWGWLPGCWATRGLPAPAHQAAVEAAICFRPKVPQGCRGGCGAGGREPLGWCSPPTPLNTSSSARSTSTCSTCRPNVSVSSRQPCETRFTPCARYPAQWECSAAALIMPPCLRAVPQPSQCHMQPDIDMLKSRAKEQSNQLLKIMVLPSASRCPSWRAPAQPQPAPPHCRGHAQPARRHGASRARAAAR